MQKQQTIEGVFSSVEPIYIADFVAVKMIDENYGYYIYKNKVNNTKGFIPEDKFRYLLMMSSYPIVLHEEYTDMDEYKLKYFDQNKEPVCNT